MRGGLLMFKVSLSETSAVLLMGCISQAEHIPCM
jgi:hypothetical protein